MCVCGRGYVCVDRTVVVPLEFQLVQQLGNRPGPAVAAPAAPTPPPTPLAENEPASSPPSPPKKGDGDDLDVLGMDF